MWVKEKNSQRRKQNRCRKGDIQYLKSATLRRIVSTSSGAECRSKEQISFQSLMLLTDTETTCSEVLKKCINCSFFFVFVWSNVCILKIKERGKISKVSITHLSALTDSLLARKLTLSNKHKVLRVFGHSPKYWANWNLIWLWCYKKSQLLKVVV